MQENAKIIIALGIGILVIGLIFYFFGNKFQWFGNLPGDFKVEKENFKFYFPLASMLIISIVFNVLFRVFKKFF